MLTRFPVARCKALVSAISSAFWEVVPSDSGRASRMSLVVTIAYAAARRPVGSRFELPSTNSVRSGFCSGVAKRLECLGPLCMSEALCPCLKDRSEAKGEKIGGLVGSCDPK